MSRLETMSPAAIDTEWAELFADAQKTGARLKSAQANLRKMKKHGLAKPYHEEGVTEAQEKHDAALAIAEAAQLPYTAEWDKRGGWTRYTLVPGGHYHRYRGCSSLRWTTIVLWTPEHSGKTEAELVAELDSTACTKCFPDAPVASHTAPTAKPGECAASRQEVTGEMRDKWAAYTRARAGYAYPGLYETKCPTCGKPVSITKGGRVRAHKAP